MPKYGDDQCVQCGGIRVARSTLCADCLVKAHGREIRKKHVLRVVIDKRDIECAVLRRQLEDALAYGFKKNQENAKLLQRCKNLQGIALRRGNNEKDGISKHQG